MNEESKNLLEELNKNYKLIFQELLDIGTNFRVSLYFDKYSENGQFTNK